MANRFIDPRKGTSNTGNFTRAAIAVLDTDFQDVKAEFDMVLFRVGEDTITFGLPDCTKFPGKMYICSWLSWSGSGNCQVATIGGGQTINAAKSGTTPYNLLSVGGLGGSVILVSDGISNWAIVGRVDVSDPPGPPAATESVLGGVNIQGTPADPNGPIVPVIETTVLSATVDTGATPHIVVKNGLIVSAS